MGSAKKIVLTVFITILATVILFGVPFYFLFIKDVEKLEKENQALKSVITNNSKTPEPMPLVEELPAGPKLVKITPQGKELVVSFNNQYDVLTVWNHWIFVGDKNYGTQDKKAQVWAYNAITGVKKKVFDLGELEQQIVGSRAETTQYVNDLQIFENKLWINLGGYMMPGYIYAIELEPELINAPVYVGESLNPSILLRGSNYIVSGGEGDAGCAKYLVQLLDVGQMNLTEIFSGAHCLGDGQDMLVGIGQESLFLSRTKTITTDGVMESDIFLDLKSMKFDAPGNTETIISTAKMPEGVYQIYLGEDYFVLMGSKLYYYEIDNNIAKLTNEIDLPTSTQNIYLSSAPNNKEMLCTENYYFDLKAFEFTKIEETVKGTTSDPCDWNSYYASNRQAGTVAGVIDKYKKDGVLPAEFEYLDE